MTWSPTVCVLVLAADEAYLQVIGPGAIAAVGGCEDGVAPASESGVDHAVTYR